MVRHLPLRTEFKLCHLWCADEMVEPHTVNARWYILFVTGRAPSLISLFFQRLFVYFELSQQGLSCMLTYRRQIPLLRWDPL